MSGMAIVRWPTARPWMSTSPLATARKSSPRRRRRRPYLVYVNYFGGGYGSSEDGAEQAAQDLTTARITLVTEEGTPNEKQETFLVPMRKPGELTLVKRFSYP